MLTTLMMLACLAQPPHPTVQSRHHGHRTAPTARDFDALLDADVLLVGRIEDLERQIKALERHRCRCGDGPSRPPILPPVPKPPVTPPPAPAFGWRTIGSVDYYGYQDGAVFRYTHYRVPAMWWPSATPGRPAGSCPR